MVMSFKGKAEEYLEYQKNLIFYNKLQLILQYPKNMMNFLNVIHLEE